MRELVLPENYEAGATGELRKKTNYEAVATGELRKKTNYEAVATGELRKKTNYELRRRLSLYLDRGVNVVTGNNFISGKGVVRKNENRRGGD